MLCRLTTGGTHASRDYRRGRNSGCNSRGFLPRPLSPSGTLSRCADRRRRTWSWKSSGRSMNSGVIPPSFSSVKTPCAERRRIISQGARRLSPLMKILVTFLQAGRCHLAQEMTRMSSMTKPCIATRRQIYPVLFFELQRYFAKLMEWSLGSSLSLFSNATNSSFWRMESWLLGVDSFEF